jgi:dipeptidyl aminopeptidase/acylaminoacyl peptidase
MHHRLIAVARAFALSALTLVSTAAAFAELPPLIPRETLFGNPERVAPQLSPDGTRLAWLAPDKKNVLQINVKTLGKDDDRVVTADKKRGIRRYFWGRDNKTILYAQDNDGDENWHLYGVSLDNATVRDYTPFLGARADVIDTELSHPDELLVKINARDRRAFDVYHLTLSTGALTMEVQNPGNILSFITDNDLHVIGGQAPTPDGGTDVLLLQDGAWKSWLKASQEENVGVIGVAPDGKSLYMESSLGRDTAAVIARNIADGSEKVIAVSDEVDTDDVMISPRGHNIQAVSFSPGRTHWQVIDPGVKEDFDAIARLFPGDFNVVSRDAGDKTWLVSFNADVAPVRYYLWDRTAKKGTYLFSARPKLDNAQLAPMKDVTITARDGMKLHSYLTLPVGVEAKNLPMILFVHGGPWGRDHWGYSGWPQWLANRGYAVLQVNFRSSTGYGKKFLHAGDRQWGLKMHDDLLDAVDWAVKQGYADPKRVAIMGGSYGGYATLAGLTFTPDKFACGVDLFGPSNLKSLITAIPPYWKPMRAMFDARMGNVDDPKDAELVRNASPLYKADQIRKPLLIGQGGNDPRVPPAESEQIIDAIKKNGGAVTYVFYSDEGHGFARPENSIDFNARAEQFLAQCVGGRFEPMTGEKMPGSTAVVKVVEAAKK